MSTQADKYNLEKNISLLVIRASSNHDAHFCVTHSARVVAKLHKSLRAPAFGLGLMKSKESSLPGISPSPSVLHAVEGSQSCSLLQPNKSALKRDILARRGNGTVAVWKQAARLRRSWAMEVGCTGYPTRRHLQPDAHVETGDDNPSLNVTIQDKKVNRNRTPEWLVERSVRVGRVSRLAALRHNEAVKPLTADFHLKFISLLKPGSQP